MNGSYKATLIFDTFEVISRVCNKIGNNDKPVCIKKLQKFDVKFTNRGVVYNCHLNGGFKGNIRNTW